MPIKILDLTLWRVATVVVAVMCVFAMVNQAWIGDDAMISARIIANALHGNGATFNVLERVQGYTSPLFFLLQLAVNRIAYDPVLWGIGLGLALGVGYIGLLVRAAWERPWLGFAVLLALASSPAFIEYTSSGLENSLGYLLFALLFVLLGSRAPLSTPRVVHGGLCVALIVLTRQDLVLLVAPVTLGLIVGRVRFRQFLALTVAAALPLTAWFLFAYLYYGYALPNTAYAKLNLEIPTSQLIYQGLTYVRVSTARQPLTVLLIALAVGIGLHALRRRSWEHVGVGMGLFAYVGYVVYVGGDFMEGRFFAIPVALSAFALLRWGEEADLERSLLPSGQMALGLILVAVVSILSPLSTPLLKSASATQEWEWRDRTMGGIADERGYYVGRGMSLWSLNDRPGQQTLRELRAWLADWEQVDPAGIAEAEEICGLLGLVGANRGPDVHIIDFCGLVDPTLARVPYAVEGFPWRVGHYHRTVPEGYEAAVLSGDPSSIEDPAVRELFATVSARVRPW